MESPKHWIFRAGKYGPAIARTFESRRRTGRIVGREIFDGYELQSSGSQIRVNKSFRFVGFEDTVDKRSIDPMLAHMRDRKIYVRVACCFGSPNTVIRRRRPAGLSKLLEGGCICATSRRVVHGHRR